MYEGDRMSLRKLNIPIALNTSKNDLIEEFFIPLLKNSVKYDRGVGYFSSSWIKEAFEGMMGFAQNGGKARWITSPILSREDWDALIIGDEARQNDVLKSVLQKEINNLTYALKHETLVALAWMIADEMLEFKLAKPRNKLFNEYHAKVGIFTDDEGYSVSFDGSYNDSIAGLHNFESIKVFRSWDLSSEYVNQEKEWFERIWNNEDPNIEVFDIPQAIKSSILRLREESERPYPLPEWAKLRVIKELFLNQIIPSPCLPSSIVLRDYQANAVESWFANDCLGIFEMATGTGKTLTALSASLKLLEQKKHLLILIVCPYIHLAQQWLEEAGKFSYRPILAVENKQLWLEDVVKLLRDFSANRIEQGVIITTNASFIKSTLREIFEAYNVWENTLLIADEVHHCGSQEMLKALPKPAKFRLGLSATPIRSYDDEGTNRLVDYFNKIVFTLDLKEAISRGFLTPYYYHPITVPMLANEFDEFIYLTKKLNKIHPNPDEPISEAALRIAIKRARVLNNSRAKITWVRESINDSIIDSHTLFYVGENIFNEIRTIIGYDKKIPCHEFTHRQNLNQRKILLDQFEKGVIKALIAMKCLDEGIDIPPTRIAYFLASSSVTREFIQRRGRVLRNSPGKKFATIYDLISIPPSEYIIKGRNDENYHAVRSAIRREYARVIEFASLAENKHQALYMFAEIADRFDLLSL